VLEASAVIRPVLIRQQLIESRLQEVGTKVVGLMFVKHVRKRVLQSIKSNSFFGLSLLVSSIWIDSLDWSLSLSPAMRSKYVHISGINLNLPEGKFIFYHALMSSKPVSPTWENFTEIASA
jgi:hypothetical protein